MYQYKIIRGDVEFVQQEVNRLLQKEWQLQGGISTSRMPSGTIYFVQAMKKIII